MPKNPGNEVSKVQIVFLLTLNGRALRQVHRLINALYRTNHYFYIHVDRVSISYLQNCYNYVPNFICFFYFSFSNFVLILSY